MQIEKYVEGKWIEVKPGDRFKLTKPDAQVFILVFLVFLMSISGVEILSCIIVFLKCIDLLPISMQNCTNCQMYLSFSMDVGVFPANKIGTV